MFDEVNNKQLCRTLQIKTGVVKRLISDINSYGKETEGQRKRIEKMQQDGVDQYDIKKATDVLNESKGMITMSEAKLKIACADLRTFIEQNQQTLEEIQADVQPSQELLATAAQYIPA